MIKSKVYFTPANISETEKVSQAARKLLEKVVENEGIKLNIKLPIKIHTGQPGNITYIKPENFAGILEFLKSKGIKPYYTETGMVTGPRSKGKTHRLVAQNHGFNQIPFVVADGESGEDHQKVKIKGGKYFKIALIAHELAKAKQVLVLSHFKGHIDAGFGGAIKMLGIGFATRRGKMAVHSKIYTPKLNTINWAQVKKIYHGQEFEERMAEYALAAIWNKKNIYLNFCLNLVENCDCDGTRMTPIYKDLGIFASINPVAIDKACFDLLAKREGRKPYLGEEVFGYSEKIGLGSQEYQLVGVNRV